MNKRFDDEDLGKRVLIAFDPNKVDADLFNPESYQIPYDAILDYEIQKIVITPKGSGRLVHKGKNEEETINIVEIAKRLGASSVKTLGDITEVAEDYLKIRPIRIRKRHPY